jgi:long-chain fatty acid transport protein
MQAYFKYPPMTRKPVAFLLCMAFASSMLLAGAAFGQAGGVYLPESGGPINGTAQAGSGAVARDAETAWLNPAGMTRLDSLEVVLTLMPFYLGFEFKSAPETTVSGANGGNQGGWLPGLAMFLAAPVNDRVAVGVSVTSPAGLVLDPSDDWVGRSWTTKSVLLALNIEPSVGVRLGNGWSVGAGLDIQYLTFRQDLLGPLLDTPIGIDGDSWNVGLSVSSLWEPLETTRFGLRFRSRISHDLKGDMTLLDTNSVSTSFTMPMSLTFSAYHEFTEQFAVMGDLGWTDWSAFDRNVITFDSSGTPVELPRNFKDVWTLTLGTHIVPAADWLIMAGGGYVSSAVDDVNRTPDLPVDQQVRISAGGEYKINRRWAIGANYTFLWLGNNKIDQTRLLTRRIAGEYDATAHLFGIYGALMF